MEEKKEVIEIKPVLRDINKNNLNNNIQKLKDKTVYWILCFVILAITFAISKTVLGLINFQIMWLKELISIVVAILVVLFMVSNKKIDNIVEQIQSNVVSLQQKR